MATEKQRNSPMAMAETDSTSSSDSMTIRATGFQRRVNEDLVVSGYCRQIQTLLEAFGCSIPPPIIKLCLHFYKARAIVNIAIGQCGNQLFAPFIDSLCQEYAIDRKTCQSTKNDALVGNTYLRQEEKRRAARALCVDLDPNTYSTVSTCPLVHTDNMYFGASGAGHNWAKGIYTEGAELIDEVMDILRKEIEGHDTPQAIQLMHSLGGGTGANGICTPPEV